MYVRLVILLLIFPFSNSPFIAHCPISCALLHHRSSTSSVHVAIRLLALRPQCLYFIASYHSSFRLLLRFFLTLLKRLCFRISASINHSFFLVVSTLIIGSHWSYTYKTVEIRLAMDPQIDKPSGHAFITFLNKEDAERALAHTRDDQVCVLPTIHTSRPVSRGERSICMWINLALLLDRWSKMTR